MMMPLGCKTMAIQKRKETFKKFRLLSSNTEKIKILEKKEVVSNLLNAGKIIGKTLSKKTEPY